MTPQRIQRKRVKGYNMQAESLALNGLPAVSVTRPGKFGNPFKVGMKNVYAIPDFKDGKTLMQLLIERNGENVYKTNQDLLDAYRQKVKASSAMLRLVKHYLKGKNLACFCKLNEPCHADILLELANAT